jgi:hypothetical protein
MSKFSVTVLIVTKSKLFVHRRQRQKTQVNASKVYIHNIIHVKGYHSGNVSAARFKGT